MSDQTVRVELFGADRLRNSTSGNPRFRLITNHGSYVTQSDAACNYDIQNLLYRLPDGQSVTVELSLSRAGRVFGVEKVI